MSEAQDGVSCAAAIVTSCSGRASDWPDNIAAVGLCAR